LSPNSNLRFSNEGRNLNGVNLDVRRNAPMTRTTRSLYDHEVGETVEGCIVLEKRIVIPPVPAERRRGVYEYLLDVVPTPVKTGSPRKAASERGSFTRSTPDDRGGVVRRVLSR
jgi:hypothetical protein